MAIGKYSRNSSGREPTRNGRVCRNGTAEAPVCCPGATEWKRLRWCKDDSLVNVWSTTIEDGQTIIDVGNSFNCYYRQAGDPTSATEPAGAVLTDTQLVSDCDNSLCGSCSNCSDGASGVPPNLTLTFSVTWCAGTCLALGLKPLAALGTYAVPRTAPCSWSLDVADFPYETPSGGDCISTTGTLNIFVGRNSPNSWSVSVSITAGGVFQLFATDLFVTDDCFSPCTIPGDPSDVCGSSGVVFSAGSVVLTP